MTENLQKVFQKIKKILAVLIIIAAFVLIYIHNTEYYIMVRFDELGPITKHMGIYYNGFKVGRIVKIEPDKDFKHTLAKVKLNYKNINLPQNTTVKVQSFPDGELYLEFVYPDSPSLRIIKRGDMLEGIAKYSIEEFMLGQNVSGVSDVVSLHVIRALNSMELANKEIEGLVKITSSLIKDNRSGMKASVDNATAMTKSLAQMADNLNQASKKINNAIDEKSLKDTISGVQKTASNLEDASDNIAIATQDFDKTMKKVDDASTHVHTASENLNYMINGLSKVLNKRFAGMRIMFGTPVKKKRF